MAIHDIQPPVSRGQLPEASSWTATRKAHSPTVKLDRYKKRIVPKRHSKTERNELCPKIHGVWGVCRYEKARRAASVPHGLYMMGTGQQASEGGGTSFLPWEHQRHAPGADAGRPGGVVAVGILCRHASSQNPARAGPVNIFAQDLSPKKRPFAQTTDVQIQVPQTRTEPRRQAGSEPPGSSTGTIVFPFKNGRSLGPRPRPGR